MIYLYGAGSRSSLVLDLLKKKSSKTKIMITDEKKKYKMKNFIENVKFLKKFNPKVDKLIIFISDHKV